jgi:AcrR family transcriptional regulator
VSPSPRPRQARAERTRRDIIDVAALAFAEHGFDRVSMNDLVRASGLTKGAFYFHFSSKEALAVAAFRAKQHELIERLLSGEQPASAVERLSLLFTRRAALLQEDPSLRVVSRLGPELNVRFEPDSEYASFTDVALALLADVVAYGQGRNEFRPDVEPTAAARAIFAWIVGLDTVSQLTAKGHDLPERSAEVLTLLLPALQAKRRPAR